MPALPWEEGYGGIIRLAEPFTDEQLINGALQFTIMSNGQLDDDVRVTYSGDNLFIDSNNETIFRLENNGRVIQLTYIGENDNHTLTAVTIAPQPIVPVASPALPFIYNGISGTLTFPEVINVSEVAQRLKVYGKPTSDAREEELTLTEGSSLGYFFVSTHNQALQINRVTSNVVPFQTGQFANGASVTRIELLPA